MSRKLALSPDVSYVLGIYRCNGSNRSNLRLTTAIDELAERFVRIAVMNLSTKRDAISITQGDNRITQVEIKNSKLKKLLDGALDRRDQIFKYRNEYSASYFAAMFDCSGGLDRRGIYIRGMNSVDKIILERLGFHAVGNYFRNSKELMDFIKPYSIRARIIHRQQQ